MYAFDYLRVSSIEEAADALAESEDVRLLAGGMSLVPVLRHRLAAPAKLVDLGALSELKRISAGEGRIRIGAMATHFAVSTSPDIKRAIPALAELAGGIGDPLVRNRGTIGGSLANNDPAADYPAALLGLGGLVHTNRRAIPADDFIVGTFETALEPDEIITGVEFPTPDCAAYVKLKNHASRFSIAGVFLARFGGTVRVGVTGAGPNAFRAAPLETALERNFSPDAVEGMVVPSVDLIGDIHASAEYRAHLIAELTSRAVARCLDGS